MLRRTEMARQGRDWWKAVTEFDAMLDTWAAAHAVIQPQLAKPNVFHLHYEDLVFDFATSMVRLNTFLGVDLKCQNILVSDPAQHFERSYLNSEMCTRILAHPEVKMYQMQGSDQVQRSFCLHKLV